MLIRIIGILVNEDPNKWKLYELAKDVDECAFRTHSCLSEKNIKEYINDETNNFELTWFIFTGVENYPELETKFLELEELIKPKLTTPSPDIAQTISSATIQQIKIRAEDTNISSEKLKDLVFAQLDTAEKELHSSITGKAPFFTIDKEKNLSSSSSYSMRVLGGLIATLGIAAVAVAFTVLNAATFGVAGLAVAGIGAAALLGGVGIFAAGAVRKGGEVPSEEHFLSIPK